MTIFDITIYKNKYYMKNYDISGELELLIE